MHNMPYLYCAIRKDTNLCYAVIESSNPNGERESETEYLIKMEIQTLDYIDSYYDRKNGKWYKDPEMVEEGLNTYNN